MSRISPDQAGSCGAAVQLPSFVRPPLQAIRAVEYDARAQMSLVSLGVEKKGRRPRAALIESRRREDARVIGKRNSLTGDRYESNLVRFSGIDCRLAGGATDEGRRLRRRWRHRR